MRSTTRQASIVTGLTLTACFFFFSVSASSQVIDPYDLGGARKPKPQLSFKDGHYKRIHQSSLRFILRNELDNTEKFLNKFLAENPGDAETHFMLGVLHAQRGNVDLAEKKMQEALAAGLPAGRLLAGPREILDRLNETDLMKKIRSDFEHRPVHGPLIGNVTDTSADFWVRTGTEQNVEVVVFDPSGVEVARSKKVKSKSADDFTCIATVSGLTAQTEFRYRLILDGKTTDQEPLTFRTFAATGKPTKFKIAFGGGAGYVPQNEKMWNTIGSFDPHAILLLGDNVYIDDPESVIMQRYTYHRRQSRPEWRKLTFRSPVFSIWDDHDFGTDDSWGGADIAIPFWKKDWVFPTFRQNWANPGYGGGGDLPGCWYSFRIGDVDFIMLDCRYYRTNPKEKPRTMLGPVQLKWLKQQLSSADGTFKVICSSVPWDFRTKGKSLDTWNGYKEEHEEILSFIESKKIEGIVLMSADRHRSDCWKLTRPNGYDLYDFNSSRLTNEHVHDEMEQAIFSYNKQQSFGLVTFDTTLEDPEVTYEVVNIAGKKPHSITIKRSKLQRQ